ncbi:hypothetical protein Lfu02_36360 [Longispora fulva]|uniref:Uncharacterized protein n=1 Tax=Longispora fulva TaxID=619741 RepID=A0A8J7H4U6_9ACTN|nr:hypothetical protein [Longispora fulva]MBG6141583.1 hypothetical protein [Longispora fulva]GIG59264.1 hypothetical protein Lfu02_36360 [Longispora fulva]
MRFSTHTGVIPGNGDDWFDPVLTEDTPLYVDPFLVFEETQGLFAEAHKQVVAFFAMCRDLIRADAGRHGRAWDKAVRLLTFPEPKEFALGLAMGSPNGAGTAEHYAVQMAAALEAISSAVERRVDYVEMFALFVPGLGVDRISDILCNILKSTFVTYTQQVCQQLSVPVEQVAVRNASWNVAMGRWSDARLMLPRSPVTESGVLLTPDRFLQDIPQRVTADGFYTWAESAHNRELREDLNYDLAQELNRKERAERGRDLAVHRPEMAFEYLDEVAERTDAVAYDVQADRDLLVGWYEAGRAAGRAEAQAAGPADQPGPEDFHAWLGSLVERFAHAVEHSDLWRVFWNDELTRHRKEPIVQAVAGQLWMVLCERSDVDVSREANVGRGPVDFKFSAGWKRRALLEVKLMSSRKLRQGAEAQLPEYLAGERVTSAYYVCVGFTDDELSEKRKMLVCETCATYEALSGHTVTPHFVDARPKASASVL